MMVASSMVVRPQWLVVCLATSNQPDAPPAFKPLKHQFQPLLGGWWQRVNDEWRSKIFIDDQPTIEVDYKGLHVAMLYAQAGAEMMVDPYDIPRTLFQIYPKIISAQTGKATGAYCDQRKGKIVSLQGVPAGIFDGVELAPVSPDT
nr:hypothetical protein [uncultured Roseovarius sp.]